MRLNEAVESVEEAADGSVVAYLESKKKISGDTLLYAVGRQGKLALCGVIGEVKRLFDIGGFSNEFIICATQADGIGKLRQ